MKKSVLLIFGLFFLLKLIQAQISSISNTKMNFSVVETFDVTDNRIIGLYDKYIYNYHYGNKELIFALNSTFNEIDMRWELSCCHHLRSSL